MKTAILTKKECNATHGLMNRSPAIAAALFAVLTSGCVQVSAPQEPIVIELNINVQQNNPELFPQ
jgi:hypothetical protein